MSQQPPGPPPGQPPGQPMPPAPGGGAPYGGAGAGQPTDAQGRVLAHWWKRAVAAVIDSIIVSIPSYILMAILGAGFAASSDIEVDPVTGEITSGGGGFIAGMLISFLILFLLGVAYYVFFHGNEKGQTPGKMIMKIQLRDEATGGQVGYGKAALRWLVALVLWALCYIPGLIDALFPLWDQKRQTLHDKAANTLVIDLAP